MIFQRITQLRISWPNNFFEKSFIAPPINFSFLCKVSICTTKNNIQVDILTVRKMSKYGVSSGLYFLLFGLNTEIYSVNFRILSEYRKIRTRKKSIFGHFSRSVWIVFLVTSKALNELIFIIILKQIFAEITKEIQFSN